ncbi:MAG: glycosyltransferase family 2 protein [Chitinivibrionales bacterium]
MEILFWGSVFCALFSYFAYPVTLILLRTIFDKKVHSSLEYTPFVTFIITVHNEERRIGEKLENTIQIDYPRDRMQILVASDGSTDRTNEIVKGYAEEGIELLALEQRGGKERAQRYAVEKAQGSIVVFSDVATRLESMGIRQIVSNFADSSIGCVSSVDRVMADGEKGGEGFYVRYEMWVRSLESAIGSVVGLSGSFFAARKEVCRDFSISLPSDFRTLLNSIKSGRRGISDPHAIGYYYSIKNESREFDRKIRTVLRGITTFFNHVEFLNVFRFGFFSYQYLSHKLMRWLTPCFLLLALSVHGVLAMQSVSYAALLILHVSVYLCALLGVVYPHTADKLWIRIPKYFVVVNYAILIAWFKYFAGQRLVMWNPSVR